VELRRPGRLAAVRRHPADRERRLVERGEPDRVHRHRRRPGPGLGLQVRPGQAPDREALRSGLWNFSDAGNKDATDTSGTYLFRSGNPIVDQSRVWAAQAQHSLDLGTKQTFTYGLDYAYTDARTGGTINGRNEDIDNIEEVGGYLYSQTRLSPKLDLIAALRADKHSALDDINWSPRAAVVFKPNDDQALRFTYNRAFSTPSNNNLFLDIVAGSIPLGGGLKYDIPRPRRTQ